MIHKSDGRELQLSSLHHAVSCIPTIAIDSNYNNNQINNSYTVDYMNDQIQAVLYSQTTAVVIITVHDNDIHYYLRICIQSAFKIHAQVSKTINFYNT